MRRFLRHLVGERRLHLVWTPVYSVVFNCCKFSRLAILLKKFMYLQYLSTLIRLSTPSTIYMLHKLWHYEIFGNVHTLHSLLHDYYRKEITTLVFSAYLIKLQLFMVFLREVYLDHCCFLSIHKWCRNCSSSSYFVLIVNDTYYESSQKGNIILDAVLEYTYSCL